MRIAPIDVELVEEARSLRVLLEKQIAGMCCEMATEEDIKWLQENVGLAGILYGKFPAGNGNAVR